MEISELSVKHDTNIVNICGLGLDPRRDILKMFSAISCPEIHQIHYQVLKTSEIVF
jgi:hypothetical protein